MLRSQSTLCAESACVWVSCVHVLVAPPSPALNGDSPTLSGNKESAPVKETAPDPKDLETPIKEPAPVAKEPVSVAEEPTPINSETVKPETPPPTIETTNSSEPATDNKVEQLYDIPVGKL